METPGSEGKPEALPDWEYELQWTRDGQPIPGATSSAYRVTAEDVDRGLGVDIHRKRGPR
jgi:uncharacterized protein (DUF2126 family)